MNIQNITIRKVRKSDKKQVKDICESSFLKDEEVFLIVESMFDIEHFYIAENIVDKKIFGFVIFGIFSIKTVHLMILAVHPNYQRKGIGKLLLERVFEVVNLTPINTIRLEVRTTNKKAISFYEKHGFDIVTTIEKYYDNNGNAFLMLKKLGEK